MLSIDPNELQRLRYRQDQTLRSVDFRDQAAMAAELRWWHNRAVHNAYGVLEGLRVTLQSGDQSITVTAGLAYDCYGRELLLTEDHTLILPGVLPLAPQQSWLLVIRYQADAAAALDRSEAGVCPQTEQPLVAGHPELIWIAEGAFTIKTGVKLARLVYDEKGTVQLDNDFTPAVVRPMARPRIATGATIPGGTTWIPQYVYTWNYIAFTEAAKTTRKRATPAARRATSTASPSREALPRLTKAELNVLSSSNVLSELTSLGTSAWLPAISWWNWWPYYQYYLILSIVGYSTWIDTSAAGFTQTPCYFAALQGPLWNGNSVPALFPQISNAGPTGFLFTLWMPPLKRVDGQPTNEDLLYQFPNFAQQQKLYVSWLGLQSKATESEARHGIA
jgi:hypothetical protein